MSINLYPVESLKVEKSFYTVYELKRKFDKKMIKIDSDFQRNDVWRKKQIIELVESILMGLPLPIFYFNRDRNGELIVVDGRQRLGALFSYMDDSYSLTELKILDRKVFCKKFSELDQIYQSKIEDYQLLAYEIMPETPEYVIFDVFDRVNRSGTKLSSQEIRNALNQGKCTILLNDIVKSELFLIATGNSFVTDKRQKAQYLLLRFVSFYLLRLGSLQRSDKENYVYKDLDELLTTAMQNINGFNDEKIDDLKNSINCALSNCIRYVDDDVFRLNKNGKRSPINMNVFETIMYIMAFLSNTLDSTKVSCTLKKLKDSKDFLDNIGDHRDSEKKVNERFEMANKIIEELKND